MRTIDLGDSYTRREERIYGQLSQAYRKKYVDFAEGAVLFSMSRVTFEKLAVKARAVIKINGFSLVNIAKFEKYIEQFHVCL